MFADNFWLFGCSADELSKMTTFWIKLLQRAGWQVPLDEATWCTSAADEISGKVNACGLSVKRACRNVGFKALGVQVTFDNQFGVELGSRIKAAWRSYHKYQDLLCCHSAPMSKRLKLLGVAVQPTLFWCAGSWNLTSQQLGQLRAVQQRMVRKMLGCRRGSGEQLAEYMVRTARVMKNLMQRHGFERWDLFYHRMQFAWGGKVARMAQDCPDRLTYHVFKYRDIGWIHSIADQNHGNQLHCRKVHTWRWERCFMKYNPKWQLQALDKVAWTKSLNDMVLWRCAHR